MPPIAIAPVTTPGAPGDSSPDRPTHSGVPARIRVRVIRIGGRTVDHCRIIRRNVGVLRINWLNDDHLFGRSAALRWNGPGFDYLLRVGFQSTLSLRFHSHPLHRIHHIGLLGDECVPQVCGPLNVESHSLKSFRNYCERLDARIPGLLCHRIGKCFVLQIGVVGHPLLKLDDFQGIGGRREDVGQQRIRIKSDRRD